MMHRYLLFICCLFATLSAHCQWHDAKQTFAIRGTAGSMIQTTLLVWPKGMDDDESTYKHLDSTIVRYHGADTLHITKYSYKQLDSDDEYFYTNDRLASRYSYFHGSKTPTVYAYHYCDEEKNDKNNYNNNTVNVYTCYDNATRTDTITMKLTPTLTEKHIKQYNEQGVLTAIHSKGLSGATIQIVYAYGPHNLPVEEKHYVNDTLTAIHTYTYTMDDRCNYTKRNHYIGKRLYRVLYRRIYYN